MKRYQLYSKPPRKWPKWIGLLGLFLAGLFFVGRWGLESRRSQDHKEGVYALEGEKPVLDSLSNGLGIAVRENHRLPVCSVQVWYRVGSVDETDRIAGISHLLEHMMFKGTKTVGPEEYPKIVQRMGGQVNAGTSKDFTFYYADVPKEGVEKVLELEADRMANLIITEENLSPEREVVKEERRLRVENDVDGLLIETLYREAFQNHPYRIDTTGTMEALDQIGPEELKAYYERFYAPNNALVVISGDIEVRRAKELVERHFGSLKASDVSEARNLIPQEPLQDTMRLEQVVRSDVQYRATVGGFKVPAFQHEDSPALVMLEKILGNSQLKTSRLYQDLVVRRSVATEVQAIDSRGRYPGLFIVYLQLANGVDAKKAREELFATLDRLTQQGPTPEELEMAKNQLFLEREKILERVYGLAFEMGLSFVNTGDPLYLLGLYESIPKIQAEDIRRVLEAYFTPKHSTFVDLVPKGEGS